MSDPAALGDVIRSLLKRLGVADPGLWNRIEEEWEELAGPPWDRQARPVSLHDGVLVVEAVGAPAVAVLKYGVVSLTQRLQSQLGAGIVTEIRVRPPQRRNR